jgi:hypothetical protein
MPMPRLLKLHLPFLALALAVSGTLGGCDDAAAEDPRADAGPHIDAGPEATSLGEILVLEQRDGFDAPGGFEPVEYASVTARLRGTPDVGWHHVAMDDGTCRLSTFTPSACEPYCDGVCVDTNDCRAYPLLVSAGTLTLTGLASGTLTLHPQDFDNFYYAPAELPDDLFADDATIRASAAGGTGDSSLPAFSLETRAVAPIVAEITRNEIQLANGVDHVVKWTPAGDAGTRMRLVLNANNQGHAQPYLAIIECDVYDDAGQIRIPAAMIDAFPETENWTACAGNDCPRSWLRRYHRADVPVEAGAVSLEVATQLGLGVEHHPSR